MRVQMTAGALTVDVQGDDTDIDSLAQTARELQEWQMRQTSEVSGAYVELKPQGFIGDW